jgi:acyl carrier protein
MQRSKLMDVSAEIIQFIEDSFLDGRRGAIGIDEDLLTGRVIDSLAVLQVLEFVDSRFGVALDLDEVTPENFQTIRAIANLVAAKRTTSGPREIARQRDAEPLRSLRG